MDSNGTRFILLDSARDFRSAQRDCSWNARQGAYTLTRQDQPRIPLLPRERSLALDLALNLLRPAEREILRLAYLERLGIEGAAGRLGIGRDAAKMRLVRARRELARKLCRWEEAIESP